MSVPQVSGTGEAARLDLFIQVANIQAVDEVAVFRVVPQHGDDGCRVEQQDHSRGNHQDPRLGLV